MNQEAAEAVEALARDRFEEKGYILLRIGKAPKRAILFRTDAPFKKIQEFLISPDGSKEKIELLGDGQQLIVDGIHPDTGKPYAWFGGKPTETKREDLPYIHEAEARQLAEDAVELLCREHGYQRAAANRAKANGADHGSGPEDWAALIGSILAGNALHDSLRDLGGKLVKSGMNKGAAVNLLRAEMDNSTAERDARWQERRDDIPRLVDGAEEPETAQLRYTDITRDPIPPREWAVLDRIPARNVALLSGEGAVGKSILLLQLCAAHALGRDWIGTLPTPGPVIYLGCEDDDDEICRRLEAIAVYYGVPRKEIAGRLRVLSFAGRDAALAVADKSGRLRSTPLLEQLKREAAAIRPKLIVLDTVADVFGGNENDRAQVRQFITILRGLALDASKAVVAAAHPSLTGISSNSGLSGSTAWHNSVRARMYLKNADEVDDPSLRALEVKKNNYGPVSETILLRWRNGVYMPEPRPGSLEQLAEDRKVDDLFIDLLRRFTKLGRKVSDKPSTSFAPALFADEPEAKKAKASSRVLREAMTRLFADNRVRVVTEGPPSHPRNKIVEASNDPSNALPTLPTGVCVSPPLYPPLALEGGRALEDAPLPTPPREGKYRVVGTTPAGTVCIACHQAAGDVLKIKPDEPGAKAETLHEGCAPRWFK